MNKKELVVSELKQKVSLRVEELSQALANAKESRNNDTKSSAGDKFETGRAMMQLEIDKYEQQLINAHAQLKDISLINLNREYNKVEFGSLVFTNAGVYFFSIGVGKVVVGIEDYYCLSMSSPIGMQLKDKCVGEAIQFNSKEMMISEIY